MYDVVESSEKSGSRKSTIIDRFFACIYGFAFAWGVVDGKLKKS